MTVMCTKQKYSHRQQLGFESFLFRSVILDEDGSDWASRATALDEISGRSNSSDDGFHYTDRPASERSRLEFSSLASVEEGRPTDSARTVPIPSSTTTARSKALMRLQRAASTPFVTHDLSDGKNRKEREVENKVPVQLNDDFCSAGCFMQDSLAELHVQSSGMAFQPSTSSYPGPHNSLPSNAGRCTIIAFVNSASGGKMGKAIQKALQCHLGPFHVIDLHSCRPGNMPEDTLIKYAKDPTARVLACGGDGTCGWILSSLDKVWSTLLGQTYNKECPLHLSQFKDHLPLAVMPLGTGNDLSRQFGWGPEFQSHMKDKSMITSVHNATLTGLDRWRCLIMPLKRLGEDEKRLVPKILGEKGETDTDMSERFRALLEEDDSHHITQSGKKTKENFVTTSKPSTQFFDGVFCNYFSLGFDAKVVYLFHHERERHPEKFTSPLKNKLVYIQKSPHALKAPKLRTRAQVLVNDESGKLMKLKIPKSCRAIILMNIQSYAGGRHLTSKSKGDPSDGVIEVIFVSNAIRLASCAAMEPVMPFLRFQVAARTNNICIRTRCPLYCQVDGEPWLQEEGIMQIKFHSRNPILKKVKDDTVCDCMGQAEKTVVSN